LCSSTLPIPIELHQRNRTALVHALLEDIFEKTPYVTVCNDSDSVVIRAPNLHELLITSMKVKMLLMCNGLEELVSIM